MRSLGSITEDFNEVLNSVKKSVMRDLRVGTFGKIIAVDKNKFTVDVQPLVEEKINTPKGYDYIRLPLIRNVRYIASQSPAVNDFVICIHFDRCNSEADYSNKDEMKYLKSNENRHNINDAVALVINTGTEYGFETVEELAAYKEEINNQIKTINSTISSNYKTLDTAITGIDNRVKAIEDPNTTQNQALSDYSISNGTIETRFTDFNTRLTNLGFRSGSTASGEIVFTDAANNYLDTSKSYINATRQGNYVILTIFLYPKSTSNAQYLFMNNGSLQITSTLPVEFRPKNTIYFTWGMNFGVYKFTGSFSNLNPIFANFPENLAKMFTVNPNGLISSVSLSSQYPTERINNLGSTFTIYVGYESNPLVT